MSLAIKTARGAIWNIGVGIGTRLVGVIGTIVIAHLLKPEVVGEVLVGTALVTTAGTLAQIGFGPYVIAKNAGRDESFHVTVLTVGTAVLAFATLWVFRGPLSSAFEAPAAARYIPALIVGMLLQRIGFVISRIMIRDLQFRQVATGKGIGEGLYPVTAVGLAAAGWGGHALVAAFVVRGAAQAFYYAAVVDRREWLAPCKLSWQHTVSIFRFGIPLWVGSVASYAARNWDNLLVSRYFGPHQLGIYNYAYNLADIPATQVGEHIGDVLLPSFARLDETRRKAALVRATALLALVVFPLAVGLGAISDTLVKVIFDKEWQGVGPALMLLSVLSIARPVGWTISTYLVALSRVHVVTFLEILKLATVLLGIALAGPYGMAWVCVGVGVAFAMHAAVSVAFVHRADGIGVRPLASGMLGPLAACAPMAAAVYAARLGIAALGGSTLLALGAELVTGGLVYVAAALLLAPAQARDFLDLVRRSLSRTVERDAEQALVDPAAAKASGRGAANPD
ncbi:MAG: oligosaccharide flippase family protein [Polyangiaceae bacterium]|nr:oligosaccharide flippase family protein [Polyangiaceae bacterium]